MSGRSTIHSKRSAFAAALLSLFLWLSAGGAALAQANPIKVGFSMSLTGAVAPNGKQLVVALEIWRDDVNAKGGLLGRQVELVYYDDQSNPSNVPAIYTKLINVDKVDLILGPYATNMVAPAMPVIMQNKKTTVSMMAIGINRHFNYPRYFSMVPIGPDGVKCFLAGVLRARGCATAETPDGGVARCRRGVRPHGSGRREGECQGTRLRHRLRPRLSAADSRLLACCAGPAGGECRRRVRRRLSARHGRHRARGERDRAHAENVRRHA